MQPPQDAHHDDRAAGAVAVLTNRALFLHATSFLDGVPYFALQFLREHGHVFGKYAFQRSLFACIAIKRGDYVMLQRLYNAYAQQRNEFRGVQIDQRLAFDHVMTYAAERRSLKALQWLHNHTDAPCEPKALIFAATLGYFDVVKWLAANRKDACVSVATSQCDAMTLTGDIELVKFLIVRFPELKLTTDAMDYAAAQGHFELIKVLHEHRREGCTKDAMDHAARIGRLDIVRFLHQNRTEGCSELAMDFAAANGHLDVVRFLHENREEGCTVNAMDEAAKNGHLQVVEFLHFNRSEGCTTFAMDMAAWNQRLDVLRFLHENRKEGFTPMAMGKAAQLGYLDVVEFLHEHQQGEVNCHEDALHEAARFGRLKVVKYLLEHCTKGCLSTARKCADERDYNDVIALIDLHAREEATSCSIRHHELEDSHRRCQRITCEEPVVARAC